MLPLINPDNTCCFTGYRPEKLPWRYDESSIRCVRLKKKLYDIIDALYFSGIRHFICGMAKGSDMFFAEAVLKLREKYHDITLEAAIPCQTQTRSWSEKDIERYNRLLDMCDYKTMVQKEYTKDCMLKRNKYMVKNSSVLVAVFDGQSGGTSFTINYAKKRRLEIIQIFP